MCPHGKQPLTTKRRPFHVHLHANIQTGLCSRGSGNKKKKRIHTVDSERRYLHKGLRLVSLRWQWWGEGWPANTKRRTLVQRVRLAAHRRNQVYTVLPGSRWCHRNSQWVSVGWRTWEETSRRGCWKVWGSRMRTGAERPPLINRHSQTSYSHLIKQTSLCFSCWDNTFIPRRVSLYTM